MDRKLNNVLIGTWNMHMYYLNGCCTVIEVKRKILLNVNLPIVARSMTTTTIQWTMRDGIFGPKALHGEVRVAIQQYEHLNRRK